MHLLNLVLSVSVGLCGCAVTFASRPVEGSPVAPPPPYYDGTCGNLDNVVNVIWAEGQISSWPSGCDMESAKGLAAVKELATRDLKCSPGELKAHVSPVDSEVMVAEGCGHRAAYLYHTSGYGDSRLIPGCL